VQPRAESAGKSIVIAKSVPSFTKSVSIVAAAPVHTGKGKSISISHGL
jgi:hypothetical protein